MISRHKSMTYGVLPSHDEFIAACNMPDQDHRDETVAEYGFSFGNDPRMGDTNLNVSELWEAIKRAHEDFENGDETAGDWLLCVLSVLGFEWI